MIFKPYSRLQALKTVARGVCIVGCILSTQIPQKERINSLFSAREFPYLKLELYC